MALTCAKREKQSSPQATAAKSSRLLEKFQARGKHRVEQRSKSAHHSSYVITVSLKAIEQPFGSKGIDSSHSMAQCVISNEKQNGPASRRPRPNNRRSRWRECHNCLASQAVPQDACAFKPIWSARLPKSVAPTQSATKQYQSPKLQPLTILL